MHWYTPPMQAYPCGLTLTIFPYVIVSQVYSLSPASVSCTESNPFTWVFLTHNLPAIVTHTCSVSSDASVSRIDSNPSMWVALHDFSTRHCHTSAAYSPNPSSNGSSEEPSEVPSEDLSEDPLEEDGEPDKSEALFSMYLDRADEDDRKTTEKWKGESDAILIFVSHSYQFCLQVSFLC